MYNLQKRSKTRYIYKDDKMMQRKIELLKIVDVSKNYNRLEDYASLEKHGFDKSLIRAMIQDDLIKWNGADFYLTENGEKTLQNYLMIESLRSKEKNKTKIMFDSNIFDEIAKGILGIDELEKCIEKFEFYITHIQIDEINNCPDKEKRAILTLFKTQIRPILIPTENFVFGVSRLGLSKLGNGNTLNELGKPKDALIGETAIKNGCVLVTNDEKLIKKVKKKDGKALTLEEFKEMIKANSLPEDCV
ncbi:MAG: hypothetical protein V1802_00790 [Candidatus Aenigmatarchaeota archaeon]